MPLNQPPQKVHVGVAGLVRFQLNLMAIPIDVLTVVAGKSRGNQMDNLVKVMGFSAADRALGLDHQVGFIIKRGDYYSMVKFGYNSYYNLPNRILSTVK